MDDEKVVYPESRELFRNLLNQLLGGRSASRSDSNYTFRPYDGVVLFTSSSAIAATIPADMFALNYVLTGVQFGAGTVTFAAGDGVSFVSKDDPVVTDGQYTMVMAKQVSENVWLLCAMESSGGGGGGSPVAPTVNVNGDWPWPPLYVAAVPQKIFLGTSEITTGTSWLNDFDYDESGQPTTITALDFTDLAGLVVGFTLLAFFTLQTLGLSALVYGGTTGVDVENCNGLTSIDLSAYKVGPLALSGLSALAEINLPVLQWSWTINIDGVGATSFNAPSLTAVLRDRFVFNDCANMATVDLSALQSCPLGISFTNLAVTELDLGSLAFCGEIQGFTMPNLTSVNLGALQVASLLELSNGTDALETIVLGSSLLSLNGAVTLSSCALDQASVDGVLVRLAALDGTGGTVSYDNQAVTITGTSSAPSVAGLAAKVILEGRGNTVTVNS